ncbi:Serpentine Receptor, class H [Caenorhabditis elegans]|uniref:Serpentine Receptor, class H n=1 Tax=Caenorhabditis elegans TaxID=6239 RepID=Q9XTV0_CAEEL|nr:Serpentine Receptor, class H [Caenorhabditis elegans]CAB11545.3 Serpentine Receptor, class H [Caenorhabditis elegans]|eukprot:NP_001346694.1 Serpentine Receptor, class H [Caenorhabditis elegans]
MSSSPVLSKSIWNENPTFYIWTRQHIFGLFTFLYPLTYYVVLFKTPKNFGSLKWFLVFHIFSITCQWLCSFLLVNFYTFVPSKITRIDGLLIDFIDINTLFTSMYVVYSLASSSCLLLFCNRILSILNMYRKSKTCIRRFFELILYIFVFLFPNIMFYGFQIPDQSSIKEMTKQISPYYPDCIDNPNIIVFISPDTEKQKKSLIFYLIYLLSLAIASILSAQFAYFLLSKRMTNQSEKTRKMHQKFNRRTLFQVLIDTSFTSIPFTISNMVTLFRWRVPELTYFVDFTSKSGSTACIFVLFLYYEPYQKWLLEVFRLKSRRNSVRHVTTIVNKSADI